MWGNRPVCLHSSFSIDIYFLSELGRIIILRRAVLCPLCSDGTFQGTVWTEEFWMVRQEFPTLSHRNQLFSVPHPTTIASGIYPLGHLPWTFSFSGDPTLFLLILTRLGFSCILLCLFRFPFSDVSKILSGILSVSDGLWGLHLFFCTLHLDRCISG